MVPGTDPEVVHRSSHTPKAAVFESHNDKETKRICGLGRRTFYVSVILLLVIFALIGALAGVLTHNQHKSNEASITSTPSTTPAQSSPDSSPTSSSGVTPSSSGSSPAKETFAWAGIVLTRSCPPNSDSSYKMNYTAAGSEGNPSQKFKVYCSWVFDYVQTNTSGTFSTEASSLEDCIDRCAAFNTLYKNESSPPCATVAWRWAPDVDYFGYCWGGYPPVRGQDWSMGRNINVTDDAPADSAILWDYVLE